jgi:hypothetical protein
VIPCQTDEPPGIQNEPGVTEPHIEQFAFNPGSDPEPPPASNLYPIIETKTILINKEKSDTCVYKGVENNFNHIGSEWMDCFGTSLSVQAYTDLVAVRDPQFIQKTLMDIKMHEGEEGIARIHNPFKFVKSLLRHRGYIVSGKRKKQQHGSIVPKVPST